MQVLNKQAARTEDGVSFPAGAYAYVPDREQSGTWKLRLFDAPGDVPGSPSVRLTAAATQALSPSGFRGNRVQIPAQDLAVVKRRVAAAWLKARAGRGLSADDIPAVLKAEAPPKPRKAVALILDQAGQESFLRLTKTLIPVAEELKAAGEALAMLGQDLVATPATKAASGGTIAEVIVDLERVAGQILDETVKQRLTGVLDRVKRVHAQKDSGFAVPQNKEDLASSDLAQSGLLQSAQGDPARPETEEDKQGRLRRTQIMEAVFSKSIAIIKVEENAVAKEERTVLGIVLEPETVDAQNDIYSADEIQKTAFKFMERFQQFGLMHKKIVPTVLPLESFLAPVDFELNGAKIKKGTWLLRVRVLDDVIWQDVKSGKLTGFSIGGNAVRQPDTVSAA